MTDKVNDKAKDLDWQTATAMVDKVINAHASRIITEGKNSIQAVDEAVLIQAAWLRVQRG
jgi:hypothetical protein